MVGSSHFVNAEIFCVGDGGVPGFVAMEVIKVPIGDNFFGSKPFDIPIQIL